MARFPDFRPEGVIPACLLPFEDDNRLSEILSKAFLLAADKTVSDRTILDQIHQ